MVVDNADPKKLGRVKVRITGLLEDTTAVNLPWVFRRAPASMGGRADLSEMAVPEVGSELVVKFPFGDIYSGFYIGYWQSEFTHQGFYNDDYPHSYGFRDTQNTYFKVNQAKKEAEFKHTTGSRVKFFDDGVIELMSAKKIRLSSLDKKTQLEFDLETGAVAFNPKDSLETGGNLHRQTSNKVEVDIGTRNEKVSGAHESQVLGGHKTKVGGDKSTSVLGNVGSTVGGSVTQLVADNVKRTVGTGEETTVVVGDKKISLMLGNFVVDITAGNIEIKTLAGSAVVGNPLAKLEISPTGDVVLKNTIGGGVHVDPTGMVGIGNNFAELFDLFDQFLQLYTAHNHGTGVGPSSPPFVPPVAIQTLLALVKGSM